MLTDDTERDRMPLNPPRPSDSRLGRPQAAEDFGVPLPPHGFTNWQFILLFIVAGEVVFITASALIFLLRLTKPATGWEGEFALFLVVYTVAIVAVFGLLVAALDRMARRRALRARR